MNCNIFDFFLKWSDLSSYKKTDITKASVRILLEYMYRVFARLIIPFHYSIIIVLPAAEEWNPPVQGSYSWVWQAGK